MNVEHDDVAMHPGNRRNDQSTRIVIVYWSMARWTRGRRYASLSATYRRNFFAADFTLLLLVVLLSPPQHAGGLLRRQTENHAVHSSRRVIFLVALLMHSQQIFNRDVTDVGDVEYNLDHVTLMGQLKGHAHIIQIVLSESIPVVNEIPEKLGDIDGALPYREFLFLGKIPQGITVLADLENELVDGEKVYVDVGIPPIFDAEPLTPVDEIRPIKVVPIECSHDGVAVHE